MVVGGVNKEKTVFCKGKECILSSVYEKGMISIWNISLRRKIQGWQIREGVVKKRDCE
jgi:hypothetical protein